MTTQNSAMGDGELLGLYRAAWLNGLDGEKNEAQWLEQAQEVLKSRDQQIALAAEQRAARKIQALINAHKGLNPSSEVLDLVETSLPILNLLEVEADLKQAQNKEK